MNKKNRTKRAQKTSELSKEKLASAQGGVELAAPVCLDQIRIIENPIDLVAGWGVGGCAVAFDFEDPADLVTNPAPLATTRK